MLINGGTFMKWDISNDKEQIKVTYSNKDEPWNIMLSERSQVK